MLTAFVIKQARLIFARNENGNERAEHTINAGSRNNLKRAEKTERRTGNKGNARISVFGATGKPTF